MKLPSPRILCATFAALIVSALSAAADDSFSGTWKITDAQTLAGKSYTGTVRIASIGAVYELQWNTTAGKYLGLGLADGNKLCTGWGGKNFGVVLYKINGNGTLSGRWTIPSANEAEGTEEASGGIPNELAGEYTIKGTNPGGKGSYTGKLRIRKTGATYQLRWTLPGGQSYSGVGLRVGDSLHVGWSTGKEPYAVISYTFDDGTAEGIWTVGGSEKTAKESLGKN
ncbi:MAG: hypothetical protein ACXWG7_00900 [Chthoniobacterales bacterium]